jgi:hypothetical protein
MILQRNLIIIKKRWRLEEFNRKKNAPKIHTIDRALPLTSIIETPAFWFLGLLCYLPTNHNHKRELTLASHRYYLVTKPLQSS